MLKKLISHYVEEINFSLCLQNQFFIMFKKSISNYALQINSLLLLKHQFLKSNKINFSLC